MGAAVQPDGVKARGLLDKVVEKSMLEAMAGIETGFVSADRLIGVDYGEDEEYTEDGS